MGDKNKILRSFTHVKSKIRHVRFAENHTGDEADTERNEEAYAVFTFEFLDDKSLSVIMKETSDNRRDALRILLELDCYAGKEKPGIISLY